MTIAGLIAFMSYIARIWFRWGRVTFRRYGLRGVLDASYRPKRAGVGHGARYNPFQRAHGNVSGGLRVNDLLDTLMLEYAGFK